MLRSQYTMSSLLDCKASLTVKFPIQQAKGVTSDKQEPAVPVGAFPVQRDPDDADRYPRRLAGSRGVRSGAGDSEQPGWSTQVVGRDHPRGGGGALCGCPRGDPRRGPVHSEGGCPQPGRLRRECVVRQVRRDGLSRDSRGLWGWGFRRHVAGAERGVLHPDRGVGAHWDQPGCGLPHPEGSGMRNRLAELRREHELSQQNLADLLGVSRQTVISIEKERFDPSLPLAFQIAAIFRLRIEDIFTPDLP